MPDDVFLTIFVESSLRGEKPRKESVNVDTTTRTDQLITLLCQRHDLALRQYVLVRQVTGKEHVLNPMNTLWQNGIYSDAILLLRPIRDEERDDPGTITRRPPTQLGSGFIYLEEQATREKFVLRHQPAIIGRIHADPAKNALLAVDLSRLDRRHTVSRHHACITYKNSQYYLTGIHNQNITYLNNNALSPWQRHPLQPGNRIKVGDITLIFHLVD